MSSSRLPGKVMLDIAGLPMLQHVIRRVEQARFVDQVVVATTSDPSDNVLEAFCRKFDLACYRGSLPDVLDRYYQAACQYQADVIIRLTADCPLLDPYLIDLTVQAFLGQPSSPDKSDLSLITETYSLSTFLYDFCANRLPPPWQRTLPIGLDVEVCSFDALKQAHRQARETYQREHVMPYLYEGLELEPDDQPAAREWYIRKGTTPRGFRVAVLNHTPDYGSLRWTVDTPSDLEFVRQVYAHLKNQDDFGWLQVLALLEKKPHLAALNAGVIHKSAFDVDKRSGRD